MSCSLRTVGIVGSGAIAPRHLRAYRELGIEVRALLAAEAVQAEALCADAGIAPHRPADLEALAAEDCDFFDVMVPPQVQPQIVTRLARLGRPILCEKPLALGVAEAGALVRTADENGVRLGVVHNQLFYGPHLRARELISSGEIGAPKLLRLHLVGHHSAHTAWKQDLQARGGMIWDDGIHR
ncbi:MAG TPA: Gfo/Idh/MocA family oxidoreductase, partial [Opitutus sp.]|nr:Gfo/Idh/MocA family oxidoreductase [Opitutus sp.]